MSQVSEIGVIASLLQRTVDNSFLTYISPYSGQSVSGQVNLFDRLPADSVVSLAGVLHRLLQLNTQFNPEGVLETLNFLHKWATIAHASNIISLEDFEGILKLTQLREEPSCIKVSISDTKKRIAFLRSSMRYYSQEERVEAQETIDELENQISMAV